MLTKWESRELTIQVGVAKRRLNKEITSINKTIQPYTTSAELTAMANIKALNNWKNLSGEEFKNMKNRIKFFGNADTETNKALLYRENFMSALEELSNYDNYDKLKNKLETIKNPNEFFNYVQRSNVLQDLFLWYENSGKTMIYGEFSNNQEAFNYAIEELGIKL